MRLIDADALYEAFERTPWMDNADRDIAEEVGFLDVAHFSRIFKKLNGISANEYRNQRSNGSSDQ